MSQEAPNGAPEWPREGLPAATPRPLNHACERPPMIGRVAWHLKGNLNEAMSMSLNYIFEFLSRNTDSIIAGALAILFASILTLLFKLVLRCLRYPMAGHLAGHRMKRIIRSGGSLTLTFNPKTGASKVIRFLPDGSIGGGNHNEARWRISRGALEILASDGLVFSRFRHDKRSGLLVHTNDPDCRSLPGQYLQSESGAVMAPAGS